MYKKRTISGSLIISILLFCLYSAYLINNVDIPEKYNSDSMKSKAFSDKLKNSKKGNFHTDSIAEADVFVESGSSSTNFNDYTWLYVGQPGGSYGIDEAFLRFNFTDQPDEYINATISLNFAGVITTYNFPVYLIEETWDEDTLKWSNKPTFGAQITTLTVSSNGIYEINVTKYIPGRNNISICVSYDNAVSDYCYISPSREGATSNPYEYPRLIWTYQKELGFNITSPKNGDKLNYGDQSIIWESIGGGADVVIKLYNDSIYVENISDSTSNDGQFTWSILFSDNYTGTKYQIQIIDLLDSEINNFSQYFEISLSAFISSNGGGGGGGGDSKSEGSIPFTNFYIIFSLSAVISIVLYMKRKVIIK